MQAHRNAKVATPTARWWLRMKLDSLARCHVFTVERCELRFVQLIIIERLYSVATHA
jgi:hypothetical protein